MTRRERFLAAIAGVLPDRVPVSPDTSNYIPAKRTGLPFWDIYFYNKIPLWKAYLDVADYFDFEAWNCSCGVHVFETSNDNVESIHEDRYDESQDAMIRHTTVRTPDGELTGSKTCFRGDPPSPTEKFIKDFDRDWPAFRHLLQEPTGLNMDTLEQARAETLGRDQAFGVSVGYPGFHHWFVHVDGGLEQLTMAWMDQPRYLDEWFDRSFAMGTKGLEMLLALDQKPDYVFLGGSGTITMASPELARRYALPAIQRWSKMAKDAGVPTLLHSCGKSMPLLKMVAEETDLDMINPLESPPMGDVHLDEAKRKFGDRIGLMGNLHTTDIMLHATPEQVTRAALEAMRDAGQGGRFNLSTGDQCGRETPDDNLFGLVEAARTYGIYEPDGTLPRVAEALAALGG